MGKPNMLQQFIYDQEKELEAMHDNSNGRMQRENMEIDAMQKVIDSARAFLVNGKKKKEGGET